MGARVRCALAVLGVLAVAPTAFAHPAPFSYVDVAVRERAVDVTVVAHVFDAAHELGIAPAEGLLDPAALSARGDALFAVLQPRLGMEANGTALACRSEGAPEAIPDRNSVRLRLSCASDRPPGVVRIHAVLFPYDPAHQTFVNVYEEDRLQAQAILDRDHATFDYFAGDRQGVLAVVERFLPAGVHHILIGPDHLLFLVGLLLLGGSVRQLALVVTAFTLAHSLTLTLAVLGVFSPPARLIEPAIALSIVYVGADNLLSQ